ncbi:motility associated factor glycosyltransferase family protein [Leptospira sp. 201903070]|uniref:Motility associated factor glycosyltransferase family protein n=1 Tax=Leptospira ainlahdjerensis TaxID=2810033 RepID=A0ABS2UF58_9LEPT|nr:6-hydroxymethylpterin diphosphokinase MptE-like protein [Leptospira ainlahdjerensis]MBM9578973.1 motility associated factor glycosyltransferase family protein [Leptospira ainlahdjerensis]
MNTSSDESVLSKNLKALSTVSPGIEERILESDQELEVKTSKTGLPILVADGISLHSSMDPVTESKRLLEGLKKGDEERVFLFFGAGIGYSIQESLKRKNVTTVWMEAEAIVLRYALSYFDYSEFIESGSLRILLSPIIEQDLYAAFRGISGFPISFIAHRGSNQWKKESYEELRFIAEGFFHKKDVNISTLTRFERIWTRNFISNLPALSGMQPIKTLFGICEGKVDVLVCGAGPSLLLSLEEIRSYRERYVIIAVDTALMVLWNSGIDPDLVFSVDPQALNSKYLEGYSGNAKIVFDPTSSYHSLRLPGEFKHGFFTSSPFPLIRILSSDPEEEIGVIDFGGSVSTNAVSLAERMEARNVLLVGQDLSFPNKLAHCKGAVLEERLNYIESRKLRREYHNHKQMTALPVKHAPSLKGGSVRTNEKLLIFKKWLEEHPKKKPWFNLGREGVVLEGIPNPKFSEYIQNNECSFDVVGSVCEKIERLCRSQGGTLTSIGSKNFDLRKRILSELISLSSQLKGFSEKVKKGKVLSDRLYFQIKSEDRFKDQILKSLKEMDRIDEEVSSRKGLTEILGMSIQRTVLMITEGYEGGLTLEEKKNERLGIAKKSLLLYQGLEEACNLHSKLISKTIVQLSNS